MKITAIIPCTIIILFSASQLSAQSTIELKKTINEKYRNYISFFATKDAEGIANLYSTDGARLSKGEKDVIGTSNIARTLQDMFVITGPVSVIIQSNELWTMDGKIYEGGKWFYSWLGKDNKTVLVQGDYLTIWTRSEGDWKIWRDISF